MENLFISDAHLGHRNIHLFRPQVTSPEHNTELIVSAWEKLPNPKRSIIHCLGDMAFDSEHNKLIQGLPGKKILYIGNHDEEISFAELLETYDELRGIHKWKKSWLSHAPIHPSELRGSINIHGHTHSEDKGEGYYNVCVESLMKKFGTPMITLAQLRNWVTNDSRNKLQ